MRGALRRGGGDDTPGSSGFLEREHGVQSVPNLEGPGGLEVFVLDPDLNAMPDESVEPLQQRHFPGISAPEKLAFKEKRQWPR